MKMLAGVMLGCLLALNVQAVEIGMPAKEAQARVESGATDFLFIDVRDPVEIMFVGFTDSVHVNIPFLLVDRTQVNAERGTFAVNRNPDFVAEVAAELERRGLPADSEIVTLCRSGSERGEPSARLLRDNGFPNARYVVHGFQGDSIKQGPQAGLRLLNGWQNEGLPWSPRMNLQKIYRGQ
jgi:rhodanese-related sulfurtransferase